jgi:6-phosphofructokinase 1
MRIGVLTGGGDAPGLNAAIRAVVLRATALGHDVHGIADGWAGLIDGRARGLSIQDVAHILAEGGTILGTSRTDPRKDEAHRRACLEHLTTLGLDALVAIGGNDTLGVADWLLQQGVKVVGVPTGSVRPRAHITASWWSRRWAETPAGSRRTAASPVRPM